MGDLPEWLGFCTPSLHVKSCCEYRIEQGHTSNLRQEHGRSQTVESLHVDDAARSTHRRLKSCLSSNRLGRAVTILTRKK